MAAGNALRILDEKRFEVIWSADGWQTKQTAISRSLGSAGYSAEISGGAENKALDWTLHWPEQDAWLGYNVEVLIEPE
jgi:hypothetical protein